MTTKHRTAKSLDRYIQRLSADFMIQIEEEIQARSLTRKELAERLGITPGRVSQIINDPGNLTLESMIKIASSLGLKVSVLAYDDGDPENEYGPILAEVFVKCWETLDKPTNLYEIKEYQAQSTVGSMVVRGIPAEWRPLVAIYTQEESNWTSPQETGKSRSPIESSLGYLFENKESKAATGV